MQVYVFPFSLNSAGATTIVLPQDFPAGIRRVRLKPPVGHAWTFTSVAGNTYPLNMDEALDVGPCSMQPGETIGSATLDSGSGNGKGMVS